MTRHRHGILFTLVLLYLTPSCGPEPEWARDPLLRRMLQQSYSGPRSAALAEFGALDEDARRAYVPLIVSALRDDGNHYVRMNAAHALGTLDTLAADALPALRAAASDDREQLVREMARESLAILGHDTERVLGDRIGEFRRLRGVQRLEDVNRRHAALRSLVRILQRGGHAGPDVVALLAESLDDPDDHVVQLAAQGLYAAARTDPDNVAVAEPALRRAVGNSRIGHIAAMTLDTLQTRGAGIR